MNRKKRILLIAGLVLALLGVACGVYFGTYSRATPEATALLQGSDAVQVTAIHGGWLLDGPGIRDALIFYPGGKVEATAYLPLMCFYRLVSLSITCMSAGSHWTLASSAGASQRAASCSLRWRLSLMSEQR